MQFVIVGLDGTDNEALDRRLAVRSAHITLGDEMTAKGQMLFGAALLNEDGTMKGSMLVMNFEDEAKLKDWLDIEPYVVGGVWEDLEVHRSNTRDLFQFNRSQEWCETNL